MSGPPVRVLRLGLRPYAEALRVQERCVGAAKAARGGGGPDPFPLPGESVVLSEPSGPVYAWGLRGAPEAEAAERLRARGAGLAAARRGGRITFHGPGQLLAFPVLDLRRRRLPLRGYVAALEGLVLGLCRRLGLAAARALPPPFTGVWMGDSKICAIGERRGRSGRGVCTTDGKGKVSVHQCSPWSLLSTVHRTLGSRRGTSRLSLAVSVAMVALFTLETTEG
uniref:Lipoyl(octanoyl) transferase 2 n=1 Tax=Calidris pygmaea TaxID=425635 RepID=A0A8C3JG75_9CHAR